MARLNIAPTKSNLISVKEQLSVSLEGYDLLEQKREILVMELMRIVEKISLLEEEIQKCTDKVYPALKKMLLSVGGDRVERIAMAVDYDFKLEQKKVSIAGLSFSTLDVELPEKKLFTSFLGTFPECDQVMTGFFDLLTLLTQLASIRTIAWRLAKEVKKTQHRVNALNKIVIPQDRDTVKYIEGVLEERDRENVFVLKCLKNKKEEQD